MGCRAGLPARALRRGFVRSRCKSEGKKRVWVLRNIRRKCNEPDQRGGGGWVGVVVTGFCVRCLKICVGYQSGVFSGFEFVVNVPEKKTRQNCSLTGLSI